MSLLRSILLKSAKILITLLLLIWILHVIFMEQGAKAALQMGSNWEELTRWEQWGIAWFYGPPVLWEVFRTISPWGFLFSLLCVGMTVVLGAWRWYLLLKAQHAGISFWRTFEITMIGQFFNSFLLGATGGDILKAWYGMGDAKNQRTEVITTVIGDRLVGLLSMLFFTIIFILPNLELLLADKRRIILILFTMGMFFCCLIFLVMAGSRGLLSKILNYLPKMHKIERALEACDKMFRHRVVLAEVFLISMVLNVFCILQFFIIAYDLQISIRAIQLALIVPMIICISSLPITPSGLGVRENLYVIILGGPLLQIEPAQALALSLVAYMGYLCWSALGAIFYLLCRQGIHHKIEFASTQDRQAESSRKIESAK